MLFITFLLIMNGQWFCSVTAYDIKSMLTLKCATLKKTELMFGKKNSILFEMTDFVPVSVFLVHS